MALLFLDPREDCGVVDNSELQGKLNTGLAAIKADGTYDKIYAKYFGAAPAAAAAPASAASK